MKNVRVVFFVCCAWSIIALPYQVEAARVKYQIISQIRNKSQLAHAVLDESSGLARYYQRYDKIYCFANDESSAAFILETTRKVYAQIADDLGMQSIKKDSLQFSVFVLSEAAWSGIGLDQGAGAFYMQGYHEIYVRLFTNNRRVLASNLAHELTHLVVDAVSPGAPLWFNEGIAQYEGDKVLGKNRGRDTQFVSTGELIRAIKEGGYDLEKILNARNYPGNRYVFYDMSSQLIKYIDARGSLPVFSRAILLEKIPFVAAIQKSISFQLSSISRIEKEFLTFLS